MLGRVVPLRTAASLHLAAYNAFVVRTFQRTRAGERMLPVEEAQKRVLDEVSLLPDEPSSLADVLGRVLREDIIASDDVPEADNSAMDGYAVRAADLELASSDRAVELVVQEDVPAGVIPAKELRPGTAARIMTGAQLPRGADAVANVEITDAGSETVRIFQPVRTGAHIRRRGEDMRAGSIVLPAGIRIGAAEIGVLAALRRRFVRTGRKPSVAILSTGNEIAGIDEPRTAGKIANSNSYALAALVTEAGGIPTMMGIVRDSRGETVEAIERALGHDFVISSGGVSAGAFDFIKDALDDLGAQTLFWQIAMKPGKPVVLSRVRERLYFGLPGNPVSCMVSFLLFVAPALRRAAGETGNVLPPKVRTRLGAPIDSRSERRSYLRVRVVTEDGQLVSYPMHAQGSGVSTSMVQANGLAIVEAGAPTLATGVEIDTILIGIPAAR